MAGQSVFLSYRRSDSAGVVARIHDVLATSYGPESVFRDLDAIGLGSPFDAAVGAALRQCRVCLVIIGPCWLHVADSQGRARLHQPDDPVALEVRTALKRGVPLIPVLVEGATMPGREELPSGVSDLALRNAFVLRPDAFHADLSRLLGRLGDHDPAALAVRLSPARLDDLVLPQRSYAQFSGVLGQLSHGADLQRQYRSLADDDGGASQTVLVVGPRGSGKTLVARVLSTSLDLDLYRIELDDLLLHWQAGDRLPLDWLYRRLGASRLAVQLRDSGGDESSRTAATALLVKTLVRHLRRRDGVLIVTRAAVPQGPAWPHFDHVMHTLSPSPEVRQTIWRVLLGPDLPLGVDVDINELAEVDLSGAEIRMSIRRAAFQALKDQRAITHADLMEAANEISRR